MLVKNAKEIARQWVTHEAAGAPGFVGAFFHGSVNWLPDDAPLPPASDLDVMVIFEGREPPERPGKFRHRGVLLEVSHLTRDALGSAEQVLANYPLAGSFHVPSIIADPSGWLTELQQAVSDHYARETWVRRRCEHAQGNVLNFLNSLDPAAPLHDQVNAWWFGAGVTTHVLLAAGLRNPTVRSRYVAVRELLAEYQRLDLHETLLDLLGCAEIGPERVQRHLVALSEAFDAAKTTLRTPYRFAADLTDDARPVAIDGSRELIERGLHGEAMFWIVATFSRCQWVFHHDAAPEVWERFDSSYRLLLADTGVTSFADIQQRAEQVRQALPRVWEVAEEIIVANPAIRSDRD